MEVKMNDFEVQKGSYWTGSWCRALDFRGRNCKLTCERNADSIFWTLDMDVFFLYDYMSKLNEQLIIFIIIIIIFWVIIAYVLKQIYITSSNHISLLDHFLQSIYIGFKTKPYLVIYLYFIYYFFQFFT